MGGESPEFLAGCRVQGLAVKAVQGVLRRVCPRPPGATPATVLCVLVLMDKGKILKEMSLWAGSSALYPLSVPKFRLYLAQRAPDTCSATTTILILLKRPSSLPRGAAASGAWCLQREAWAERGWLGLLLQKAQWVAGSANKAPSTEDEWSWPGGLAPPKDQLMQWG